MARTPRLRSKFIFITGGVVSSLGKGITISSLGILLQARGLKVNVIKLDPYLNVDAGTMNPYQHGEVYVTEDGAETSLLLATSDEVLDHNGAFWSEGKLKDPNPIATPELAAELWARSEAWTAPA